MNMYRENIMDHYKQPRNKGVLKDADIQVKEYNPVCGDEVIWYAKIEDGKLKQAVFDGHGCAISQAAASMLTDEVIGKSPQEIMKMENKDVFEMLGVELSPMRVKCALLGLKTLQKGIVRWQT